MINISLAENVYYMAFPKCHLSISRIAYANEDTNGAGVGADEI